MAIKSDQQRINEEIAYELDKYQVMLEYGRLFLDRDKAIHDKHKWMNYAKTGCLSGAAIDIAISITTSIFSTEAFVKYLPWMLIILVAAIAIYFVLLFSHRKRLANLISKDDKEELKHLLDNLQEYLHKLGEWLKDVDSHIVQKKGVLDKIRTDLAVAKSKQAADVNKLSDIYGDLDTELDEKAHRLASDRLKQYIRFIYEQDVQES